MRQRFLVAWERVDWTLDDAVLAEQIGCSASLVKSKRGLAVAEGIAERRYRGGDKRTRQRRTARQILAEVRAWETLPQRTCAECGHVVRTPSQLEAFQGRRLCRACLLYPDLLAPSELSDAAREAVRRTRGLEW